MALARLRVLSSARRNFLCLPSRSVICSSSSSNLLLERLIREPVSEIKTLLDSEMVKIFGEFKWDTLVTSLRQSSPHKAKLVLEWRLEKLLKENERNCDSYSDLIYLCGKIQNVQIAMRAFTLMESHGIKPTSAVLNALISAHLSSGNVITALSLFETMKNSEDYKPSADTYNVFIMGFANLGKIEPMQAWYSAKTASGFSADLETYEALILGFVKSKKFDDADKLFEEMLLVGIMPSTLVLRNMLVAFCERRNLDKIKGFLKLILDNGWRFNGPMAEKLVGFYCELGMVNLLEELLINLTKTNQDLEVISQIHSGIIRVYTKLDRLDDVEYSVGRMLKQGLSFGCPEDVEKVLCSYFRRSAYDRLDLFLECLKKVHYKLERSTYDLLVAGYRKAGLYEKVDLVIKDMKAAEML